MRLQSIATIVGSVKDAAYASGNKEIVICTDDIYTICFEKKYKVNCSFKSAMSFLITMDQMIIRSMKRLLGVIDITDPRGSLS